MHVLIHIGYIKMGDCHEKDYIFIYCDDTYIYSRV